MVRALLPASFVREAPTNNQSGVPVTATRHCLVPVLPRRAKTSFPGREAAPLRFAAPSAWVQKGCWSVSAPPVPAPPPWLMRMCAPAEGDAMGSASRLGQSPPLEESRAGSALGRHPDWNNQNSFHTTLHKREAFCWSVVCWLFLLFRPQSPRRSDQQVRFATDRLHVFWEYFGEA